MRQQGQRAFGSKAFPGPASARQRGVRRRQHGMLAIVAAQVGGARAVRLHGDLAQQGVVPLRDAHPVRVLAFDQGARAGQHGDATGRHALVQLGVQAGIGHHAAQLRHAEIRVLDNGAAQAPAL
ncbi:hypothetical protein D3C77_564970 [compost metagenome]